MCVAFVLTDALMVVAAIDAMQQQTAGIGCGPGSDCPGPLSRCGNPH